MLLAESPTAPVDTHCQVRRGGCFPRYPLRFAFSALAPVIEFTEVFPLTQWVLGGLRFQNGSLTVNHIHHH